MSEQQPKPMETNGNKPKNLVVKLCEVMAAVGWVAKTGYNEFHRYRYATEADLVEMIRGELSKRNVFIFPSVIECKRTPHEVETQKGIRKTQLTEIAVEWTFVCGDTGEERKIVVHGVGEDNVDKGFYKAFTGSEKYMLMKSFLIPTGDDPERDSKEAKQRNRQEAKVIGEGKIAAAQAKKSGETPVLFITQVGERYEISGAPETLNAHKELLIAYGKPRFKENLVEMTAEQLDTFKFEFERNRGGLLKALKSVV